MPLPDPGTRSPGHLFLAYITAANDSHTCSVRLRDGVDIEDVGARRADALAFSEAVVPCLPPTESVVGWGLRNNDGVTLFSELFDFETDGTHTTDGYTVWKSLTVSLTGHGDPASVGDAHGQARLVLYVTSAFAVSPGTKAVSVIDDDGLDTLRVFLTDPATNLWADFYGSPASVNPFAPVQFNAHTQRELGC